MLSITSSIRQKQQRQLQLQQYSLLVVIKKYQQTVNCVGSTSDLPPDRLVTFDLNTSNNVSPIREGEVCSNFFKKRRYGKTPIRLQGERLGWKTATTVPVSGHRKKGQEKYEKCRVTGKREREVGKENNTRRRIHVCLLART